MKHTKTDVVLHEQESWLQVEDAARDAVVQIYANIIPINWLEPYKTEPEFEQRGTGFFSNEQGDIITNAHVVHQAKRIWVQVPALGHRNIPVTVVGFCPDRDLALLRMGDEDRVMLQHIFGTIPFLRCGDSDHVRRTEKVLTLGYPLGQSHLKSSTGIISGTEFVEGMTLLQITAPINPGNSGGPLLNMRAEVIGITIASVLEASNIGYAIPINDVVIIADELYAGKFVRKPMLGLRFNIANDFVADYLGNPTPAGAYINTVFKDSLAEQLGLQPGDMLYACNGYTINSDVELAVSWQHETIPLYDLIARMKIGDSMELEWYRAGTLYKKQGVIADPPQYPIRVLYPGYDAVDYEIIAGIVFMQLAENHFPLLLEEAPHLQQYQDVEYKYNPVVVITHIVPGSAAQQLRSLSPGDTLKTLQGKNIKTLTELRMALQQSVEQQYLSITTEHDVLAVFLFDQILHEQERLARDYGYTVSSTMQELLRMRNYGSKKTT